MKIYLNGEPRTVAEHATVADLVRELELAGRRLAVEVNEEVVPRSQHGEHRLRTGDRVEIVQAVGGG